MQVQLIQGRERRGHNKVIIEITQDSSLLTQDSSLLLRRCTITLKIFEVHFARGAQFSASCTIVTDPEERRKILRRKARCFLCLRSGHVSRDCSEKGCYRCHGRHHTALCNGRVITESDSSVAVNTKHQAQSPTQSGGKLQQQSVPQPHAQRVNQAGNGVSGQPVSTHYFTIDRRHGTVLLQTANAVVSNLTDIMNNKFTRLLFDNCSQKSYITEELRKELGLSVIRRESQLKTADVVQLA